MREIKFRAWFPKEYYETPHMSYWSGDDDFGGRSSTWDLKNMMQSGKKDNPIYMQYTGLKDKNGKEIYESDYVKNHNGYVRRIDWIGAGFWVVDCVHGAWKDLEMTFDRCKTLEVIGNIYENKEILKKGGK